ncbi:MAG: 16S rRNA (adenine(1518)-N(6)/adenine(1519)-N(6))-dimethyltransferase RsmA [Thermodesulfovibrionales bacterium]|nr:16S rRNA (adenine(1518)-N(6)/adenine(1519)-N(6))-dimethyltransferase RsmA [Thermodesulfovibrionales bacterium]
MAKKHLSQNFLYDPSILGRIIQAAGLLPDDTVVEIGPGPGRLTMMLASVVKEVIAIEFDRKLYEDLNARTGLPGNIRLIQGDALKYPYGELEKFKVVSNIPYHITTPLIFRLLEHGKNLISMTLTVQKEVAERIVAVPGGKDYGVLSIMLQYHAGAELKFLIPRGAFSPVPKVDSACIHIRIYDKPVITVRDEEFFSLVVKTAFSQRRKTLLNSLKTVSPDLKEALIKADIDPQRRPETLSIEEFARLSEALRSF